MVSISAWHKKPTFYYFQQGNVINFDSVSAESLRLWISKYHWKDQGATVFISNQDENIKTKNITEKIDFEQVAGIMATCK